MRKKLTDSVSVDELVRMYNSGMSFGDIGNSLGVSYQTIRNYLIGVVEPRARGGRCASKIPGSSLHAKSRTLENMAVQNAVNACLVVEERTIGLVGQVGRYVVHSGEKNILCQLDDTTITLQIDAIPGFIEELKALMRNVGAMTTGCEMW